MERLKYKVTLITGASRGIGLATAHKFAQEGSDLMLIARSKSLLENLAKLLNEKYGVKVAFAACDIAKPEEIEKAFEVFKKHFSKLHILINNAGRGIFNYIQNGSVEEWKEVIDLNLTGLIYLSHLAVKLMIQQKDGHIINISSVAGRVGIPGWSVYCATKWGVIGFSESLRKELLKYNIRVTLIEPGVVKTDWGENMPEEWILQRSNMKALKPEDVAEAIFYAALQPPYVSINEILIRPTEQER